MVAQDWEEPETWLARREKLKEKHHNGNGVGTPLAMAAKMWPTPTTMDAHSSGGNPDTTGTHGTTLTDSAARLWRTPDATITQPKGSVLKLEGRTPSDPQVSLADQASSWPTPRARDEKGQGYQDGLPSIASSLPDPTTAGPGPTSSGPTRRLNPRFVAWLMGLPVGWTDTTTPLATTSFEHWATASSLSLRHWLSVYSQIGRG